MMVTSAAGRTVNRSLRGRCLLVVDIENIVGGAVRAAEDVARTRNLLQQTLDLSGQEQVVIGTSHYGLLSTGVGWQGPRLLVRSGIDGADMALLEVLTQERVEERFDHVVLASGDGIFADALAALGARGLRTTVVARLGHCSARLRLAASKTVLLSTDIQSFGGAA